VNCYRRKILPLSLKKERGWGRGKNKKVTKVTLYVKFSSVYCKIINLKT
jgi:hypothetical protein